MKSLLRGTRKDIAVVTLATMALTFLIWLPFILKIHSFFNLDFSAGFNTIYRNFDGLEYIVIAKSFYFPSEIAKLPISMPAGYFASHFPGYSLFILLFAPLLGFLKSMLFVSGLFTTFSVIAFYFLLKDFDLTSQPLWLSLVFLVLPARWVIIHSVGAAEPTFIFFVITTIYFFMRFEEEGCFRDIILSGVAAAFAQLTRPPGILLFAALGLYLIWNIIRHNHGNFGKRIIRAIGRYYPMLLTPITLLAIFYWYSVAYHNFFAYFHSGDNIHLGFLPFQVFNKAQPCVGDIWLEDIIYIFMMGLLGGLLLLKHKLYPMAFFVLTYFTAIIFVAHRDISRYILPIFPFVLIAFEKVLVSKEFKITLAILLLAIYLYAQNFIIANIAPIPNLQVFN